MVRIVSVFVAAAALAVLATGARAQDGELTCEDARCLFQQQITADCPCDQARNHGQYVKCVGKIIRDLTTAHPEFKTCRGKLVRCAARSTCGKGDFVTCNKIELGICDPTLLVCSEPAGQVCATNDDCLINSRCSTKRSAESCEEHGGVVGLSSTCCSDCVVTPPTP